MRKQSMVGPWMNVFELARQGLRGTYISVRNFWRYTVAMQDGVRGEGLIRKGSRRATEADGSSLDRGYITFSLSAGAAATRLFPILLLGSRMNPILRERGKYIKCTSG